MDAYSGASKAPRRSALIGAVLIGNVLQIVAQGLDERFMPNMQGIALIGLLSSVVPILIALMTRRSPAAVTTIAVTLSGLAKAVIMPSTIIPVLITAALIWIACTWTPMASDQDRREPGTRMNSHWWMPVTAIILFFMPYAVRSAVSDPNVPVGIATAIFTMPISMVLMGTWIPAFVTDAIAAISISSQRNKREAAGA